MHRLCHHVHTSERPLGLWTTLLSVLAAFFGVQSSAARRRDFTRGSVPRFLIVALGLTLTLVLTLTAVVHWMLRLAGEP